jgi:hypothetical protein
MLLMISFSDFDEVVQTLFHAVANFGALIVTTFLVFFDAVIFLSFILGHSGRCAWHHSRAKIGFCHAPLKPLFHAYFMRSANRTGSAGAV